MLFCACFARISLPAPACYWRGDRRACAPHLRATLPAYAAFIRATYYFRVHHALLPRTRAPHMARILQFCGISCRACLAWRARRRWQRAPSFPAGTSFPLHARTRARYISNSILNLLCGSQFHLRRWTGRTGQRKILEELLFGADDDLSSCDCLSFSCSMLVRIQ